MPLLVAVALVVLAQVVTASSLHAVKAAALRANLHKQEAKGKLHPTNLLQESNELFGVDICSADALEAYWRGEICLLCTIPTGPSPTALVEVQSEQKQKFACAAVIAIIMAVKTIVGDIIPLIDGSLEVEMKRDFKFMHTQVESASAILVGYKGLLTELDTFGAITPSMQTTVDQIYTICEKFKGYVEEFHQAVKYATSPTEQEKEWTTFTWRSVVTLGIGNIVGAAVTNGRNQEGVKNAKCATNQIETTIATVKTLFDVLQKFIDVHHRG